MKLRRAVKLQMLFVLCGLVLVAGMEEMWVEFRAPRFVVHHHNAMLRCEHNVEAKDLYKTVRQKYRAKIKIKHKKLSSNDHLEATCQSAPAHPAPHLTWFINNLKVVFYKDGQRLMKYVRERDPQYEFSNFTFADNNLLKVTPTTMMLEHLDFAAAGKYACEVAIDTPLYSKISKIHELNVIVRQKYRPKIKIKHKKLSSNDHLEATCQSAPAHPAPHLTWFINNLKVDERLTVPHGAASVPRHHHGQPLYMTNSSLHFPLTTLQLFPNQTVDITCLSTIPTYASMGEGFADVQNHTVTVNVVRIEPAPTQLPVKIVSSELSVSTRCELDRVLIVLLLLFVCHSF